MPNANLKQAIAQLDTNANCKSGCGPTGGCMKIDSNGKFTNMEDLKALNAALVRPSYAALKAAQMAGA
jgi:hypothetical protein